MKRLLAVALALLASAPVHPEDEKTAIRFFDNSVREGVVTGADASGIRFMVDGTSFSMKFAWDELAPEDAQRLQARYLKAEIGPSASELLTFPGVRLTLKGGEVLEGTVDDSRSGEEELFFKNSRRSRFIRRSEIVGRENVILPWHALYTADEIVEILQRKSGPPETPEQREAFARLLLEYDLRDRAQQQFFIANILRRPEIPENKFYGDLLKLQSRLDDVTLSEMVAEACELHLANKIEAILDLFDRIEERMAETGMREDLLKELKRLRTEANVLRQVSMDQGIVSEWHRQIDALLLLKACDRGIAYGDAVAFVKERMTDEIARLVAGKFSIGPEDPTPKRVWERRAAPDRWKMSYDAATWLVERPDLGDPDAWWRDADNNARFRYLKGLYVESAMHVLKILEKTCAQCGGLGIIADSSANVSLPPACPSCRGLKHDRCVVYR